MSRDVEKLLITTGIFLTVGGLILMLAFGKAAAGFEALMIAPGVAFVYSVATSIGDRRQSQREKRWAAEKAANDRAA